MLPEPGPPLVTVALVGLKIAAATAYCHVPKTITAARQR